MLCVILRCDRSACAWVRDEQANRRSVSLALCFDVVVLNQYCQFQKVEVAARPLLVSSGVSWLLQLKQFMNGVDLFADDVEFQYEFQESAVIS